MSKAKDGLTFREKVQEIIGQCAKDWIQLIGIVREEARRTIDGKRVKILDEVGKNTITNASLAVVSWLLGNTGSQTAFTYLANGSDNTAAAASQTALQSENTTNWSARAAATVSRVTTTQTNDTLQLVKTWTFTWSITVQEVGIFNNPTTGVMLWRKVVSSKTFGDTDTYTLTYQIVLAGA